MYLQEKQRAYHAYFTSLNNDGILACINKEVGNSGWTAARSAYLAALTQSLQERNIKYAGMESNMLSLKYKVKLIGNELVRV